MIFNNNKSVQLKFIFYNIFIYSPSINYVNFAYKNFKSFLQSSHLFFFVSNDYTKLDTKFIFLIHIAFLIR